MPQLISFASWLSRAEDSWFLAVCEARPDLLRSDTPDAAALAARAATRAAVAAAIESLDTCLLYTSPSPRDRQKSRMPSSA